MKVHFSRTISLLAVLLLMAPASSSAGTFTDVTRESGADDKGRGKGVALADIDGDGDWDMYVSNKGGANVLYRNDSTPGAIRFTDITADAGDNLGDVGYCMGSVFADGVIRTPRAVVVRTKASGELAEVLVDDGDRVRKGQLLARIDQRFQKEGDSFKPGYIKILEAGGSKAPAAILAESGIDINSQDFWQGGFDVINGMVKELEVVLVVIILILMYLFRREMLMEFLWSIWDFIQGLLQR